MDSKESCYGIESGYGIIRSIWRTCRRSGRLVGQICVADTSKNSNTRNNKQVKCEHSFILSNKGQPLIPSVSQTCKKIGLATRGGDRAWSHSCSMPRF